MSRKIHHGGNGSYKTSGALADDLMPAVEAGRTIVSNTRGLTDKQLIINAWYKLQPFWTRVYWSVFLNKAPIIDFKLIHIDTEHPDHAVENIEKMRRWMEWVPEGALIIFDEIGEIYDPDIFTARKWREYDYPEVKDEHGNVIKDSKQASVEAGRWQSVNIAFQKHRHFNLDMIFTAPDLDFVHKYVMKGSDMCYKHFNLANAGGYGEGKYREIAHSPINKGATEFQEISNVTKKIPQPIFEIYKSTSTGTVQDTIAGTSLWAGNRKLRYLTYFVVFVIAKSIYDFPTTYKTITGQEYGASKEITAEATDSTFPSQPNIQNIKTSFGNTHPNKKSNVQQVSNENNVISGNHPNNKAFDKGSFFIDSFLTNPMLLVSNTQRYKKGKLQTNETDKYTIFENPKTSSLFTAKQLKKFGIRINYFDRKMGYFEYKNQTIPFQTKKVRVSDFPYLPSMNGNSYTSPPTSINTPFSGNKHD